MGRLVVVKFHTNIANRWLFMIQRKNNGYHSLFIKLFGHVWEGVFSGHGVEYIKTRYYAIILFIFNPT